MHLINLPHDPHVPLATMDSVLGLGFVSDRSSAGLR
jgi:hypothetical protein